MIQRVQSIWLLFAGLANAGLFYFSLYKADKMVDGIAVATKMRINDHFLSLLLTLAIIAIPLVAIFLFKKRKQQMQVALLGLVGCAGFIVLSIMRISNFNNSTPAPVNGSYMPGIFLPIISMIFLVMAMRGIRKDEKLVKSLDRLR